MEKEPHRLRSALPWIWLKKGSSSREEAVLRVTPDHVDFFLHPQFDSKSRLAAKASGDYLATGLNVSPGAAIGVVALDANLAESWAKNEGKQVIMVRAETRPDDVHGMLAAQGILTSRGGRTSHAALVARQFGKPAVVGVSDLKIDMIKRRIMMKDKVIREGDWISIDGTVGEVYLGKLNTTIPDINDPWLIKLLSWADKYRRLGVWANADYPRDAARAREYGAEGIGLCRSEHMFFETERLPFVQKMIMTDLPIERREALDMILPFQREDFYGIFKIMDGLPVIIRLLDPPLHEFLPSHIDLVRDLADLKLRIKQAANLTDLDDLLNQIRAKEIVLKTAGESERIQSHAGNARGSSGDSHSGSHHHAGKGGFRGCLHGHQGRHSCSSGNHDSAHLSCERAEVPTRDP